MRFATLLALTLLAVSAAAQPSFTEVTAGDLAAPISSWGTSWVDADGDGDLDVFVSRHAPTGGNALYLNDGGVFTATDAGALTDATTPGSLGHSWADYDNDGDLDVYAVGGWNSGPGHLFRNDGGTFTLIDQAPVAPGDDNRGWTAAWGDFDADGFVDLVVAHPAGFVGASQPNHLFHNSGDGSFARITDGPIVTGLDPYTVSSWADYDLDGDLDLFIGSGPASGALAPDNLYANDGSGTFTRIATDPIATDDRDGQVMNWIDADNDGDLDLFVTNYFNTPNDFYRNDGGSYTKITGVPLTTDVTGLSLANTWGDIDNDGDLDVFVANGRTGAPDGQNNLYLNDGTGSFTRVEGIPLVTLQESTAGAAFGDYDGDGDLDLITSSPSAATPNLHLWRNDLANGNASFKLDLIGTASNRAALGAKVWATATLSGQVITQHREVSAQSTFNGQNALTVHIGLGDATTISELRVEWPSGAIDTYTDVVIDDLGRHATAREGQGITPVANEPADAVPTRTGFDSVTPNPSAGTTQLRYTLATSSSVRLVVYDVLGREVAVLAQGTQPAGRHTVPFDARTLPSGRYVARLQHEGGTDVRTLTITH